VTDPLIAAARFLTAQLPWLRHATDEHGAPYAADVFREIGDCAARMRSLVDGPAPRKHLGICGATVTWDDQGNETPRDKPCAGHVLAKLGAKDGICDICGARWDVEKRREAITEDVRGRAFRASEIEDAYGISANLIRQWATPDRGLLRIHDHDVQGRARYLLSDVLDLAARQAAKRLERQADRERRAARREGATA
jgi:hypothetical protein